MIRGGPNHDFGSLTALFGDRLDLLSNAVLFFHRSMGGERSNDQGGNVGSCL